MSDINMSILYVNDTAVSTGFYAALLERQPVEASPGFVVFLLESGHRLALWARESVQPAVSATGVAAEMVLNPASPQALEQCYARCCEQGLTILQPPTEAYFGYNFLIQDPDGLRLRFLVPASQ